MGSPDSTNTREQLLLAAIKVFAKRGYQKATVREICRLAGAANLNAVNYYFGGKENLYRTILELMFAAFEKRKSEATARTAATCPEDRLRAYVSSYCAMVYGSGEVAADMCAIFMAEMLRPSPFLDEMAQKYSRPQTEEFLEILSEILGPEAPRHVLRDCAVSIFGQLVYYVFIWPLFSRAFPDHPRPATFHEQLAEHVFRFSLGGLEAAKRAMAPDAPDPPDREGSIGHVHQEPIGIEVDEMVQEAGKFEAMPREEFLAFLEGIGKATVDGRPVEPSRTAFFTAFMRAFHSANENLKIFDDYMAARLLTTDEYAFCEEMYYRRTMRSMGKDLALRAGRRAVVSAAMHGEQVAAVLCRARFAEDSLDKAIAEGISQYVLLGAGFDTFALRRPDLLARVRVIEVDRPETQAFKRQRLAEAGFSPPPSLHFVPVDFSRDDLSQALLHSCYDAETPTFFSWLGVTYYLERDDVFNVLRRLSETAAPRSLLAFDYMHSEAFDPDRATPQMQALQGKLRSLGEPLKTGFDPAILAKDLMQAGWELRRDLSADDIKRVYFRGCEEGFQTGRHLHLALAALPCKPQMDG